MFEEHADWSARAAECRQAAQLTMEASAGAVGEEAKAEFLRVATEWLRLADAIDRLFVAPAQA